jgi:hypothetical protein
MQPLCCTPAAHSGCRVAGLVSHAWAAIALAVLCATHVHTKARPCGKQTACWLHTPLQWLNGGCDERREHGVPASPPMQGCQWQYAPEQYTLHSSHTYR